VWNENGIFDFAQIFVLFVYLWLSDFLFYRNTEREMESENLFKHFALKP